ncbi:MAG: lamin tail domain-containing protein [Ignavibacteria bacterium]|nr:lamin tail domain-containing protein [Ignavibacteria bacterium]
MTRLILSLIISVATSSAQLIISEVHPTPSAGEPEWVECVNTTSRSLVLRDYLICDTRTCVRVDLLEIPARGLVVLTRDASALRESRWLPRDAVMIEVALPSLNNTTDRVEVRDDDSVLIDSMSYDVRRHVRGRSIERAGDDRNGTVTYADAWSASLARDSATCGQQNSRVTREHDLYCSQATALDDAILVDVRNVGRSAMPSVSIEIQTGGEVIRAMTGELDSEMTWTWKVPLTDLAMKGGPEERLVRVVTSAEDDRSVNDTSDVMLTFPPSKGTVLINEVLADPLSGSCEYVEVWNGTTDTIDLLGWIIEDASGLRSIATGSCFVLPQEFGVLASDTSIQRRVEAGVWSIVRPATQINSTTDMLVLRTPSGFVVDSMSYTGDRHHALLPSSKGVSLEKLAPPLLSNELLSWTSSGDLSGGTPGRPNSMSQAPGLDGRMSAVPSPFSSDPGRRNSTTVISWTQPFLQAIARVGIRRPDGMFVTDLLNAEFISREGGVVWNGTDAMGQRLSPGPYVVVLECVDAASSAVYRDRCLVIIGE